MMNSDFTESELEGIVLLADIAKKMARVLTAIGMEMSDEEQMQALQIRRKAQAALLEHLDKKPLVEKAAQ